MAVDMSKLKFDSDKHEYSADGEVKISVTQLLVKVGICQAIPESLKGSEKLVQAAEYGTMVHAQIEELVKNGEYLYKGTDKSIPTADFRFFERNVFPMCKYWFSEVRFYTDLYAGCCDLVGLKDDGTLVIIDHKTGTSWTNETVGWQMFMYYKGLSECGLLPEHKTVEFYCDDLKGTNSNLVRIAPPTEEEYQKLIEALKTDTVYVRPSMPVPAQKINKAIEILQNMPLYKALKKDIEDFTADLKKYCLANGINELSVNTTDDEGKPAIWKWYFTKPSYKKEFLEEKFKEENPELYSKYLKETQSVQFRSGWDKKSKGDEE